MLKIIIFIFLVFDVSFYISKGMKLSDEHTLIVSFITTLIMVIIFFLFRNIKIKKENKVRSISEKYKKLVKLNEKYDFINIGKIKNTIVEYEYSHKGFDRARADSIILYKIENNENNIRDFILNAYRNKKSMMII